MHFKSRVVGKGGGALGKNKMKSFFLDFKNSEMRSQKGLRKIYEACPFCFKKTFWRHTCV
jgi:hypothetical protein